jgi:hypothetical protein
MKLQKIELELVPFDSVAFCAQRSTATAALACVGSARWAWVSEPMNAAQTAFVSGGGAAAVAVAAVAETILGACFPPGARADSGRERAWFGRPRPARVPMPWHRRTRWRQPTIADRSAADTRRRAACRTRAATATRRVRSGQREAVAVAAAAGAAAAGRATMPPPGRRCRSRPPLAVSSVAACVVVLALVLPR